jgi:hypothetical protein
LVWGVTTFHFYKYGYKKGGRERGRVRERWHGNSLLQQDAISLSMHLSCAASKLKASSSSKLASKPALSISSIFFWICKLNIYKFSYWNLMIKTKLANNDH